MIVKKTISSIFSYIAFVGISTCYAANTYSYLWASNNTASGYLRFDGLGTSVINTSLSAVNSGVMTMTYVDCAHHEDTRVYFKKDDEWIFVPKSISLGGSTVAVTPVTPSGFVKQKDINGYYVFSSRGSIDSINIKGGCSYVGYTYAANKYYPPVHMTISLNNVPSGYYTGYIPVKIAFGNYYGIAYSDITPFSDSLAFQYSYNNELPYDIYVRNKCIFNPDDVYIDHGTIGMDVANGSSSSKMVNFSANCDQSSSLRLNIIASSYPSTSYSNGTGIGLGNGWDSVLSLSDSHTGDSSSIDIPVYGGMSSNVNIKSTIKKTSSSRAGRLDGSAILRITLP